jgi:RND family efflux transporter MFP subunit
MNSQLRRVVALSTIVLAGCGVNPQAQSDVTAKPGPPAVVDGAVNEAALSTITLSADAERKLDIQVEVADVRSVSNYRTISGEITLPPGHSRTVTAPVAGTLTPVAGGFPSIGSAVKKGQSLFRLVPLDREARGRDVRADAQKELDSAKARVEAAQARSRRAAELLRDGAGSQRNVEEAQLELATAQAAERAAQEQLNYLSSTPFDTATGLVIEVPEDGLLLQTFATSGQVVPAGAQLAEVAKLSPIWIRVPVYVGELDNLSSSRSVVVHGIGEIPGTRSLTARRVEGVPSANAAAATSNLFYELDNVSVRLKPGEKVGVSFASQRAESLVVPWSSVIHDIYGGQWVYENTAPQTYTKRRVEVMFVRDGAAVLRRGPTAGAKIVKTGAAELFGTEFGVGK